MVADFLPQLQVLLRDSWNGVDNHLKIHIHGFDRSSLRYYRRSSAGSLLLRFSLGPIHESRKKQTNNIQMYIQCILYIEGKKSFASAC